MANDLQSWFKQLPGKLQRQLAADMKAIADDLAADIRAAAPQGETGRLRQSVRVRRTRNTLELFVEAGGALTTREVRAGSGVAYDYALAEEFGTSRQPARPFFYSTYRARAADVREQIEAAVARALTEA